MTPTTRAAVALALLVIAAPALARPEATAADIAKARADCRLHRDQALALDRLGEDSVLRRQAYRTWEHACAMSQALQDARAGRPILQAESR